MKRRFEEQNLRQIINHLDWLTCSCGYYNMSYHELCQYVHRIYTMELEPLRQRYREGNLNERMHRLLTSGYKNAVELCKGQGIEWPPQHESLLYSERLASAEKSCEKIVDDFQRLQDEVEAMKCELKKLKRWSKHLI